MEPNGGQGFWDTVWGNLSVEIIGAVVAFVGGLLWSRVPKSIRAFRIARVFGSDLTSEKVSVCYGTLKDTRPPNNDRYLKLYRDGRWATINGPNTNIVGECEIRAYSYLAAIFPEKIKGPTPIESDIEALKNIERTLIAIGSPYSNEVSEVAIKNPKNVFYEFVQDKEKQTVYILDKRNNKKYYGFLPPLHKDLGLIIKVPIENFPNRYMIMCGGLGESGTSGASWYFYKNWMEMEKRFGKTYGVLVEVENGIDKLAKLVPYEKY